ncbi:MAG: ATP-binding cassette domain-containing protein [Parafannyhessea sp.]|uniref:ATP-binding cassette domain-containing protein n=1 Tax=Parafannyhessea sp. TaxID=2847324 RepID=UPI003F0AFD84
MRERFSDIAKRLAPVALWVCVWQVASLVVGSGILLAGPVDTVMRLASLLGDAGFLATVGFSLARIAVGFVLGFAGAVALAFAGARWRAVRTIFSPALDVLKSVPIVCVIVLLLMWVGAESVSAVAVFLAVFPAVFFSCSEALDNVDAKTGEMLGVFGVPRVRRLLAHVWPEVLPYLLGTSRNVCGMAWKAGVAAELIGSPMGSIGERIYQAKLLLETADLFAWTIVVVVMSWLCERAFVALLARTGSWALSASLRVGRPRGTRRAGESGVAATGVDAGEVVLSDATIGYPGHVVARGVNLRVRPGERVICSDASGAGKTTLLRTVAGLQPVLDGTRAVGGDVTMAFQDVRLVGGMSAVQNLLLVTGSSRDAWARDRAGRLLGELLPAEALDVPVDELSGGQRRRVELARAMAAPSDVVLLDEPFSSLDAASHEVAARFVTRHLGSRTLIVASHASGDAGRMDAEGYSLGDAAARD